ncbi:MAG: hypothetical protein J5836_00410 [Clostridia bacterium]|nr:hypothetical protein [Clostridia bacterium]
MSGDVTILVSSCDLYEDAWMPFFRLLEKNWQNCEYPKILSTERKVFDFQGVKTINYPFVDERAVSWTERLRYTLNQIKSEYVLWFLDDFFLTEPVDEKGFEKALSLIESDKDIGLIKFLPIEKNTSAPTGDLDSYYCEVPVRKKTFRTRVCVSLFKRKYFLDLLYGDESPWQYERQSHFRSMYAGYKIYQTEHKFYKPVFSYTLDHDFGVGITARKWLPKTRELFEKNGIHGVDFGRLGVLTDEVGKENEREGNGVKKIGLKQFLYNKIVHPIKYKTRHWWWLQDLLNIKTCRKWRKYYKQKRESEESDGK